MGKPINELVLVRGLDKTGGASGDVIAIAENEVVARHLIDDSHNEVRDGELQNGEPWGWVESIGNNIKADAVGRILKGFITASSVYVNQNKQYTSYHGRGSTVTVKRTQYGNVAIYIPDTDAG